MPSVAIACALSIGSLAACSADGTAPDDTVTSRTAAQASTATWSSATAPPSSITVDSTEVATDPPAARTGTGTGTTAQPTAASEGQQPVTVTTTYAGQDGATVEASGFVLDAIESDGTCTLTLTSGSMIRTVTGQGVADASTTSCAGLRVSSSELAPGRWQAVLSYSSPRSLGSAEAVSVEVE
jgi:hypothetical protein